MCSAHTWNAHAVSTTAVHLEQRREQQDPWTPAHACAGKYSWSAAQPASLGSPPHVACASFVSAGMARKTSPQKPHFSTLRHDQQTAGHYSLPKEAQRRSRRSRRLNYPPYTRLPCSLAGARHRCENNTQWPSCAGHQDVGKTPNGRRRHAVAEVT